jgi:hypothetical protein
MKDIDNIATEWARVDVLVYSPTITAGVSFKEKHFDRLYGFFRVGSAAAAECDQMLGRVRDIGDRVGVIYIDPMSTECIVTSERIRAQVLKARSNVQAEYEYDTRYLDMRYTRGGVKILNEDYFEVWLGNAVVTNLSRANLARELIRLFKASKVQLEVLPCPRVWIKEKVAVAKEAAKEERRQTIAQAEDIDDSRAETIAKKESESSAAERTQLYKHKLARWYGVDQADICAEWLETYDNPNHRAWHRNLCDITTLGLAGIHAADRERATELADNPDVWNKRWRSEHHRIAGALLTACGFEGVMDTTVMSRETLLDSIRQSADELAGAFAYTRDTFKIRGKQPNFAGGMLKPILEYINSVLHHMYGIKVASADKANKGKRAQTRFAISHLHQLEGPQFTPKKTTRAVEADQGEAIPLPAGTVLQENADQGSLPVPDAAAEAEFDQWVAELTA